MEAAPALFAVDEKVLVGDNAHEAYVARPVRAGDDTVLVRWESTKKEEEVAVGDVKKIDLDAKRPTRGKRRGASGAEAAALARRGPPGKRMKKKDALREEIERHVKALQSGDADGKEAAVEALEDLANKDNANRTAIAQRLVALVANGAAGGQESAARALANLAHDAANRVAIAETGGIPPLVALVANGAAGGQERAAGALANLAHDAANRVAIAEAGGIPPLVALVANGATHCQVQAAGALENLAYDNAANKVAIAEAGGIPPLVALVSSGAAGGQATAAWALRRLAYDNTANQFAIVAAGGVEALVALQANGSEHGKLYAKWALTELPVAEYASRLQSENASLKRRLGEEDVVDLRDDGAPPPEKKRTLRDAHDEQQTDILNRVKQENVDVEGQRDRTDATAAAASAAAAKASAAAATANDDAEEAQDTLGYQVRFTDALQTKIDELHALASQVDPVAADAIKNRQN